MMDDKEKAWKSFRRSIKKDYSKLFYEDMFFAGWDAAMDAKCQEEE